MEYTTNKKYKKPDLFDKVSVQEYNENFDAMDANMAELEEKTNTAVKNASDALEQIEAAGGKVMTSDTLGVGKVDGKTVGVTEDGTLSVIAKASDIPATDSNNILGENVSPTTQALIDAIANKVVNELVTNAALTSTLANYMTKSLMSSQNADNTDMVPTLALTNAMQKSIDTLNSNIGLIGREYNWRTYSTIQDAFSNNLSVFKDEKTVLFSCMLEGGSPFIVIAHKSDNFIHAICQTYTHLPTTIYSTDFGATWTSV